MEFLAEKKREQGSIKKKLSDYLDGFWVIKNKTKSWKWRNIDLALRDWYREVGAEIDFEGVYLIEWDLVITKPLSEVYAHIKKNEIGITGVVPLAQVESRWSWTSREPERAEWISLLSFVRKKYNYTDNPQASLGPGTYYPKVFLKKYSRLEVPEWCHDELRVPLFAQITKTPIRDTRFYREWYTDIEKESFNCNGTEIPIRKVLQETDSGDRFVFHPVRKVFPIKWLGY